MYMNVFNFFGDLYNIIALKTSRDHLLRNDIMIYGLWIGDAPNLSLKTLLFLNSTRKTVDMNFSTTKH